VREYWRFVCSSHRLLELFTRGAGIGHWGYSALLTGCLVVLEKSWPARADAIGYLEVGMSEDGEIVALNLSRHHLVRDLDHGSTNSVAVHQLWYS
jgi:hypothetical protein